jgi:hypothetical protein
MNAEQIKRLRELAAEMLLPIDTDGKLLSRAADELSQTCGSCAHWDNLWNANKYHGICRLIEHKPFALISAGCMTTHRDFGCRGWDTQL